MRLGFIIAGIVLVALSCLALSTANVTIEDESVQHIVGVVVAILLIMLFAGVALIIAGAAINSSSKD